MENKNPNFKTWQNQNNWEKYICNTLNDDFKKQNMNCHFEPSSEFENKIRHTDCFLCNSNGDKFRIDFKTVKWNSPTDRGAHSNFSINANCFSINDNNPTQIFVFIGERAEYAYFVTANKIITDEIKFVICSGKYGKYNYFSFNKTKYENSYDYILFENDYIKNAAFYQFKRI